MSIQAIPQLVAYCDGCNRGMIPKDAPLWEIGAIYDFCWKCKDGRAERVKQRRKKFAAMTTEERAEYTDLCQPYRRAVAEEMQKVADRRTLRLKQLQATGISDDGTGLVERIGELLQDERLLQKSQERETETFYAALFPTG